VQWDNEPSALSQYYIVDNSKAAVTYYKNRGSDSTGIKLSVTYGKLDSISEAQNRALA
jgi:hypothetical protein